MFTPIRKNAFRWQTPDPDAEWMMVGHLLIRDSGLVLVDPPVLPGLIDEVCRIGKIEGIIITTLDHIRGSDYIAKKAGATVYIPDQDTTQVDEIAVLKKKRFKAFETYSEGRVLGLDIFRVEFEGDTEKHVPSVSEFALLTEEKDLIVGDSVVGTPGGKISVFPEWFSNVYSLPAHEPARSAIRELVRKTRAQSLFSSHGCDVYGNLEKSVNESF